MMTRCVLRIEFVVFGNKSAPAILPEVQDL